MERLGLGDPSPMLSDLDRPRRSTPPRRPAIAVSHRLSSSRAASTPLTPSPRVSPDLAATTAGGSPASRAPGGSTGRRVHRVPPPHPRCILAASEATTSPRPTLRADSPGSSPHDPRARHPPAPSSPRCPLGPGAPSPPRVPSDGVDRGVQRLRGDPTTPSPITCLPPVPRRRPRRPRRPLRGCHPAPRVRRWATSPTGAGRGDASVASHLPFPGATSSAARSAGAVFPHIPPPRRPWHPRGRRNAVTRGDELRMLTQGVLVLRGCRKLRARCRAQLATHAPPRRPRRHPRRPAPRRDLPRRRYDQQLANRAAAMTARGIPPRKPRRRRDPPVRGVPRLAPRASPRGPR